MGNSDSKLLFRQSFLSLVADGADANESAFQQVLSVASLSMEEVRALTPPSDVRALLTGAHATWTGLIDACAHATGDMATRVLMRVYPCLYELHLPHATHTLKLLPVLLSKILDALPGELQIYEQRAVSLGEDERESLACLLILLSACLYDEQHAPTKDVCMAYLCATLPEEKRRQLLFALMNTAFFTRRHPAWISWTATSNDAVSVLCVHLSCILTQAPVFQDMLSSMPAKHFPFLTTGILDRIETHSTLVFLLTLLQVNTEYLSWLTSNTALLPLLHELCQQLRRYASLPTHVGHCRVLAFILHLLSARREFAVLLNAPCTHQPAELPRFTGGWSDDLLLTITHVILVNKGRLPINDTLLTVLANVSPYIKSLSVQSSNKLLAVFSLVTQPAFISQTAYHHALIFFLLDVVNNLVQYQAQGNAGVVYEVLRHREMFERLAALTFEELPQQETFHATKEWFEYWHRQLPLSTVQALLDALSPDVEARCQRGDSEDEVLTYLKEMTLVGLLPVPHPIFVRKFQSSLTLNQWLQAFMWGGIYLELPHWQGTEVRMFIVK